MDSLTAGQWVTVAVAGATGVWTVVMAILTFRRKGRQEDSAEAREAAAKLKADTIAEYTVLYSLKCAEAEKLKQEKGELVDKLTTERIRSGGLEADKRNLAEDLRQAQRELRRVRASKGVPAPEEDGGAHSGD